jgi:hypothetical protein
MKKIKRLILHIGTPKTGSTSIQESLGNSRDALLEHNIHYPSNRPYNHIFSFIPFFLDDPDTSFVFTIQLKPDEDKNTKLEGYRETWVKEIESCEKDHFIISAEDFTFPYFTEDAVERLKSFTDQYFEEVTVIAYVRHYDQWIASQIQQDIKNGVGAGLGELIQRFITCPPWIAYRNCLGKWIRVFGQENLVVRPFDPQAFYQGSLLADFFHYCNLPVDKDVIHEYRSNESIGKNAAIFLQEYNQVYPRLINNSVNQDRGLAEGGFPFDIYRDIPDERFRLELVYTPEQARKFNEEIDFVNQFFADGYKFHRVFSNNDGEINVLSTDEIPIRFYIELVNSYHKRIGHLRGQIETHRTQNDALRAQNEGLRDKNNALREHNNSLQQQIIYNQKIIDLLRIPLILRILEKLKLKALLQRVTRWGDDEED